MMHTGHTVVELTVEHHEYPVAVVEGRLEVDYGTDRNGETVDSSYYCRTCDEYVCEDDL